MADRATAWGVKRTYTGYRGDVVTPPESTIEAIVSAMAGDRKRPPAPSLHSRHGGEGTCAPPPKRVWGWAVQAYAIRSRESWGIGDLADLRRMGRWARDCGASVMLISPLGAQASTAHQEPCPYYSSSRRFRNTLYLRVEEIPGAKRVEAEIAPLRDAARRLNLQRHINHDAAFELKSRALEAVYRAEPEPRGLASWVRSRGRALIDFAAFNAIEEVHGTPWRRWPAGLRHPRSAEVEHERRRLAGRVAFHEWTQFHIHRQLGKAAAEIDLIADVPVGFAADGFDAWRWQDLLAPGMRVGAPPDFFFPDGQDWGMPAFDPFKLAAASFEPFVDALRGATSHAGGVRLDHVMSLWRLFWIPEGAGAPDGAYVTYPSRALLEVLVSESKRSNAFVIGEDLGLVEPSVRAAMRRRRALGYRLMWFEETPASSWPRDSVASIGTHDLPTVPGIWTLKEPDHRHHHLRDRLTALGLPDETDPVDVAVAAYEHLARARSRIALASLEDALGVEERPNVPGTTSEWPNWRLALPQPLEDIEHAPGARRIAEAMAAARRSVPRR
ncbi:MAG TPA: 4-alpha-glucanotransferase [Candidatus Dormibacteraeota bacterium]|nr:4-alpha-glucanotransferase [Candidatus Dormibacteraeota bacterium]